MFIRSTTDNDELTEMVSSYENFCVDCSVTSKADQDLSKQQAVDYKWCEFSNY